MAVVVLPLAALAALVAGAALLEPPLHDAVSFPGPGEVVGVLHVHTVASDGGGTLDDVLAAAHASGLDFVLLTDHNLWGAPAGAYRDSVLLIVGEEVNTSHGHLVVAGAGPVGDRRGRPGEGETRTAGAEPVEGPSVGPEEGLRIVAHPTGKPRWTGWTGGEFDGIEIWNADTERRNDGKAEWLRALALVPVRPMAGLYRLLDHPAEELALWDRLLEERSVVGVCAVDAHHSLPLTRSRSLDLHFPAYRHSFSMARQHVLLDRPPGGDPQADGRAVVAALARGRSYCAFDGLADARGARFTVLSGAHRGTLGDTIPWTDGARLEVELPRSAGEGLHTEGRLVRDGGEVHRWSGAGRETISLPGPGIYRVEVLLDRRGRRLPWILTNPVWITEEEAPATTGDATAG